MNVVKNAIIQVTHVLNGPMFNLLFYWHIISYWEKGTSHEKCSHNLTLEVQILLRLWTKVSLCRHTEIYRHLLSKGFKYAILKRQEMVHCNFFIWHQTKKSLLENLYREAGFWLCSGKHIIFNIKWFEVHKISERYGANLYYKTSDLFPLVFLGLVTFS